LKLRIRNFEGALQAGLLGKEAAELYRRCRFLIRL